MAIQGIIEHMLTDVGGLRGWTPRLSTFELSSDLSVEDVQGYPSCGDGILQNINTIPTAEIFTLFLSNTVFDFLDYSRLTNQNPSDSTNFTVPQANCYTVPAAPGPYTVTVTGLVVDQVCQVTTQSLTNPQQILQQPSTTGLAAGRFEVTANTVTFDAAQAGEQVVIRRFETVASGRTIGLETGQAIGEVSFRGTLVSPNGNTKIYVPNATRASGSTIGVNATSDIEYRLNLQAGFALPFILWQE